MSSILLSRHGPVAIVAPGFPTRDEFQTYVNAYERSGICADTRPPAELTHYVSSAAVVFTSPTMRAKESLKLLHPERALLVDPVFSEERQTIPNVSGRWPLLVWFSLTRGLGAFHPGESAVRLAMRERADKAANLLIDSTAQGPVALIGHGWFNRAIARSLSRNGWRRVEVRGGSASFGRVSSTWGYVVFNRMNGAGTTLRDADDEP